RLDRPGGDPDPRSPRRRRAAHRPARAPRVTPAAAGGGRRALVAAPHVPGGARRPLPLARVRRRQPHYLTYKVRVRALSHARISDDRRGRGLGVQRQQEDCYALVERHGWTLVGALVDNDVSAYSGKP